MKTLKYTSKKAQHYISAYKNAQYCDINQVYKTFSNEKKVAQDYCTRLMMNQGGYGFRILSWNTFHFTCAWRVTTGLRVETAKHSYLIDFFFL